MNNDLLKKILESIFRNNFKGKISLSLKLSTGFSTLVDNSFFLIKSYGCLLLFNKKYKIFADLFETYAFRYRDIIHKRHLLKGEAVTDSCKTQ